MQTAAIIALVVLTLLIGNAPGIIGREPLRAFVIVNTVTLALVAVIVLLAFIASGEITL